MTADFKTQSQPNESWDMIIQPQRGLLDLRLGELWKYRNLVLLFGNYIVCKQSDT